MPPIDVYRIGDMHFVRDGHHRVSVARQLGLDVIEAYVTEIETAVGADSGVRVRDLTMKSHQRLFFERVPLPAAWRARIALPEASQYAELAEGVEAWGFRAMQARGEFMTRQEVARAWFEEEFRPVTKMLADAGLVGGDRTPADAYLRVADERYRLMRTHEWNDQVIERLRRELR